MFVLTRLSDVIPVAPELFDADYTQVLVEEIDRKYANKVIADVGLCLTLYDFVSIGDAFVHPADGTSHSQVEFRLVVFRPFVGEVLKGRIVSCTEEHIRVSMDFVQDIIIPSYALQTPSYFDAAERLWVWKYSEGQEKFYMDLHEEIRFRVTNINFTRVTKTAKGAAAAKTTSPTETVELTPCVTLLQASKPPRPRLRTRPRRRSAPAICGSHSRADGPPASTCRTTTPRRRPYTSWWVPSCLVSTVAPASRLTCLCCVCGFCWCFQGTIDEDGLGLSSWWTS
ncbi:unnamed protein product [Phytophthora lilii]|uniref:Unnamed protein product n=1 Tax=Phytophthora lilii TaxID=2077276 RepID=A0A9W6TMH3_9STRA|nr:unnamed protein product [Phytophthora lilii]